MYHKRTKWLLVALTAWTLISIPAFGLADELPHAPPTLSALVKAIDWLEGEQNADGSWGTTIRIRDTTFVVSTLAQLGGRSAAQSAGEFWLISHVPQSNDDLARTITALHYAERNATSYVNALLLTQSMDESHSPAAWGLTVPYAVDSLDSALTLMALYVADVTEHSVVDPAIAYLVGIQNQDGGWGIAQGGESITFLTATALDSLADYRSHSELTETIPNGLRWLENRQNPDGGWGDGGSTVYETALVVRALRRNGYSLAEPIVLTGYRYLIGTQNADGDWNNSPYQTALAMQALMTPCELIGDFDGNGQVNETDSQFLTIRFGSQTDNASYHWLFDLNDDGRIDAEDLETISPNLGFACN